MDRSLFERAVKYHGSDFDSLVKEEQTGATFLDENATEVTDSSAGGLDSVLVTDKTCTFGAGFQTGGWCLSQNPSLS